MNHLVRRLGANPRQRRGFEPCPSRRILARTNRYWPNGSSSK